MTFWQGFAIGAASVVGLMVIAGVVILALFIKDAADHWYISD